MAVLVAPGNGGNRAGRAGLAQALDERLVIAGADHNDGVMFGPRVARAVARLADQVG